MLKPIPVEEVTKKTAKLKKKTVLRNSGNGFQVRQISGLPHESHFLKSVGLSLVEFFKRGAVFTVEQITDLIEGLQRSVLRLQKKRNQLLAEEKKRILNGGRKRIK